MTQLRITQTRGSAVVALMLVAVIILGAMLTLHTAAIVSVGNTSRALETARENATLAARLERSTREAAQTVFGVSMTRSTRSFAEELNAVISAAPLGSAHVTRVEVRNRATPPRSFPDLAGPADSLLARSSEFDLYATPLLLTHVGPRVAESRTGEVNLTIARPTSFGDQTYSLSVYWRLVAVPLTRYGAMAYDLPDEIGRSASPVGWPTGMAPEAVGPRGLVADRDPANVSALTTGQKRPEHYRYDAALAEAYQYVFSRAYLQNAADCAGQTHFVQIGAGPANPQLEGGVETGNTYTLDVAQFGVGTLGPNRSTKNLVVFAAPSAGSQLTLTDSGGGAGPILVVLAGPSNLANGPVTLQLATSLQRPVILVCYHAQLSAAAGTSVNGAFLFDKDSVASPAAGPVQVGHISYWSGGSVSPNAFRLTSWSREAEELAPRVIYVATSKAFL